METGSKKMIYRWNSDLNIITQQTEESKRSSILTLSANDCAPSWLKSVP
jgi:hypothetical protein